MFKNYLSTACRNLLKTRLFSLANILGLAIGIASSLLILHYVIFEMSYDKFHPDYQRIYRLRHERTSENGSIVKFASCCPPAAPLIRERYPEVEKIGRIIQFPSVISHSDQLFLEERTFYAEPDFLEVLPFQFIQGDPLNGLRDLNSAFISQSTAKKYFRDKNPIGQTIRVNRGDEYKITGVFGNVPANSHIKFDILLCFENVKSIYDDDILTAWGHTGFYTYLHVRPDTDINKFKNKLAGLVESEFGAVLDEYNMAFELILQPLVDIHLDSHFMQELETGGSRETVNALLLIAAFIMIIAWVNYINLSTARSLTRAREVGIRKVVGATPGQLMFQFLTETALINLAAIIFAIILVILSMPFFSILTGTPADYFIWTHGWFNTALAAMFAAGVGLAGFYPATAMASHKPVRVLRGIWASSPTGINLRKVLVVLQFVIALTLLIGVVTVYQQISFMQNQDPGFKMEQILIVQSPRVKDEDYPQKFKVFKESLLNKRHITQISHITEAPGKQILWDAGGIFRYGEDKSKAKNYQIVGVDEDFINLFKIKLIAGRNFSQDIGSDQEALILNRTAVKWMGFESPKNAVGEKVDYWGQIFNVIGVLEDYHQESPKKEIEPHLFRLAPTGRGRLGQIAIKIDPRQTQKTIGLVQKRYSEFFPGNPFEYFFLDEYYNRQYQAESLFGKIMAIFTVLAIFVTVLGIFGLSSFTVTQRTKEIGIRKVLGASVPGILLMLFRDLGKWGLIANIIAWPLAYLAMNSWLQNFASRVAIGIWVFLLAGSLALAIALATVGYQAVRAALSNPVDSLRYE